MWLSLWQSNTVYQGAIDCEWWSLLGAAYLAMRPLSRYLARSLEKLFKNAFAKILVQNSKRKRGE